MAILAQMHFSPHFISKIVLFHPTFSLFHAAELQMNRYPCIEHSFVVWTVKQAIGPLGGVKLGSVLDRAGQFGFKELSLNVLFKGSLQD